MSKPVVSFVSLGCPKALVDTETMMGALASRGYRISFDTDAASVVIINTCSFIEAARRESFEVVREFAAKKQEGRIDRLFVAGCLPELVGDSILSRFPEVDGLIRLAQIEDVAAVIDPGTKPARPPAFVAPRLLATRPHTAYLKIAEGCDNCCSYCLIPRIRGRLASRPLASIEKEAIQLASMGVKELNIVAQDVAAWGRDLPGKPRLSQLLDRLCNIPGLEWIRLLYVHPASISDDLIEAVATHNKVCKYLDIPIQHSEDHILAAMNRRITRHGLEQLLLKIKDALPSITIRTTVMVGFPGETERDFQNLLSFVESLRFNRLGAFIYSKEPLTPAAQMPNHIPAPVKRRRYNALMRLQAKISLELNRQLVGSSQNAIVDAPASPNNQKIFAARTQGQAPQIDGTLLITGEVTPGQIVTAKITGADEYGLVGELLG